MSYDLFVSALSLAVRRSLTVTSPPAQDALLSVGYRHARPHQQQQQHHLATLLTRWERTSRQQMTTNREALVRCLTDSLLSADVYPIALGLALLLAGHGYKKGSLSTSGALAAFVVGYLTMANPLPTFGVVLIVFYLTGSKATKVKADIKAQLERENDTDAKRQHKSAQGGARDAWQVLCNGFIGEFKRYQTATSFFFLVRPLRYRHLTHGIFLPRCCASSGCLAAVLFRLSLSPPCVPYHISLSSFCSLSTIPVLQPAPAPRHYLILALAHFSACMGDTLASELGILSRSPPFLFFSLKPRTVPPGTNGGMSAWGTLCSALGGLWIGVVFFASIVVWNPSCLAHISRAQKAAPSFSHSSSAQIAWPLFLAVASGFVGSLIDSVLGATLQRTWYNTRTKQVLLGSRSRRVRSSGGEKDQEKEWSVVTGYNVLSNNQVNLVSSLTTAVLAVAVDAYIWR